MLSLKNSFIFVHIPKSAGLSIRSCLREHASTEVKLSAGHPYFKEYEDFVKNNDTEKSIQDYFVFTCSRNPFDRLLSAYFFIKNGGIGLESDQCLRDTFAFDDLNFTNFIKFELKKITNFDGCKVPRPFVGDETPRHFHPQVKFIDKNHIDYVMRFEDLENHFSFVCSKLGIPKLELPKRNLGTKKIEDYKEHYTEETRQIVELIYKEDLEYFNYEF